MMALLGPLAVGFALGVRHATDADHLVAIGAMLERRHTWGRSLQLAASWGLGHSLSLCTLGFLIVVADIHPPREFDSLAEAAVAVMLIGLGLLRLLRPSIAQQHGLSHLRPFGVGVVHGLGGSGAVVLFAVTTVAPQARALGYLVLFAFGTVAGMVVLTFAMSSGLNLSARAGPRVIAGITKLAAIGSVAFGIALAIRLLWSAFE